MLRNWTRILYFYFAPSVPETHEMFTYVPIYIFKLHFLFITAVQNILIIEPYWRRTAETFQQRNKFSSPKSCDKLSHFPPHTSEVFFNFSSRNVYRKHGTTVNIIRWKRGYSFSNGPRAVSKNSQFRETNNSGNGTETTNSERGYVADVHGHNHGSPQYLQQKHTVNYRRCYKIEFAGHVSMGGRTKTP